MIKFILTCILVLHCINCVSIELDLKKIKKPIFYSNISSKHSIPFEVDHTNFYFYSMGFESNKTIEELIESEFSKNNRAVGIKNLQVTIYNKSWLSYSLLPNPLGIFTSTFVLIGNIVGISNKSMYITGEFFYDD
ncbi:hypothetical protein [Leptospira sp. GIMC2001]|uniref:hypothetical protein n=1 Tax=Leptospira sp. GIMC2001 TaxID=1513297 RepID=UPI0023497BEC|nr:hypothetical protein [Leptospira sp. GIMC2001]WCL47721.1 hypothetical protein O4O04_00255 [Leptospira sp. GIMC2001]